MPYVSDVWELWRIGFFDGEGHIGIYRRVRRERRENYYLTIAVTNTREETIVKFHQAYPGTKGYDDSVGRGRLNAKPLHRWEVTGKRAAKILRSWQPYLIAHADRAELALEFAEYKETNYSYRHSDEVIQRMRMFSEEMHRLNKRGR